MRKKEYLGGERKKMDEKELKNLLLGFLGIETQITEVLPEVNDIKTLIVYWKNTSPKSKLRELVEARIVEVLSEIKDMETLMFYRRYTYTHYTDASSPDSLWELHWLVNARIIEILPKVNDMKILMSYWDCTDFTTKSNESVSVRIVELIRKATVSDEWFFAMIKDRSVPSRFQDDFRQRATELLCEL